MFKKETNARVSFFKRIVNNTDFRKTNYYNSEEE